MKARKMLACLLAVIIIMAILPSCGKSSETKTGSEETKDENVELRFMWWGGDTRHKATIAAIEDFEKKYPNIKVKAEYAGFGGYFDKLTTQLAGNTGPDVVQLSYTNVVEYVLRNQLIALNDYFDNSTIDKTNLPSDLIEMYNFDDKLYGVPAGINAGVLFYNKDIFDKYEVEYPNEDWTWDDYFETARKLTKDTDGDGETDMWGTSDISFIGMDVMLPKLLYERGGRLWNDDLTKAAFNSPEGLEVFKHLKSVLDDGLMPPPAVTSSNAPGIDDFMMERIPMIITNSPSTTGYKANVKFKFGITQMPSGKDKNVLWTQPSMVFTITKDSKHPEASAKLIDFMVNDEEAAKKLGFERGVSPNSKIREKISPQLGECEQEMLKAIDSTIKNADDIDRESFPPGTIEILNILDQEREAMYFGKKTPEEALNNSEKEVNKILSKFYENK